MGFWDALKQFGRNITGIQARDDREEAEDLVDSADSIRNRCEQKMRDMTTSMNMAVHDYQKTQERVITNTVVVFRGFLKDLPFKRDDREYKVLSDIQVDKIKYFSVPEIVMNTTERLKTFGAAVLFGIFGAAYTASKIRARQLTEAREYYSKVKQYEAECERQWELMRGIMRRAEEQGNVLSELETRTVKQLGYLKPMIYEFMMDEDYYIFVMEKVRTLLKSITTICSTPLLNDEGQLYGQWNQMKTETKLLLEKNL